MLHKSQFFFELNILSLCDHVKLMSQTNSLNGRSIGGLVPKLALGCADSGAVDVTRLEALRTVLEVSNRANNAIVDLAVAGRLLKLKEG